MANFERIGQKIEREPERLKRYLEKEVRPATKKRLASALRTTSARLAKLARELDRGGTRPGGREKSAE